MGESPAFPEGFDVGRVLERGRSRFVAFPNTYNGARGALPRSSAIGRDGIGIVTARLADAEGPGNTGMKRGM